MKRTICFIRIPGIAEGVRWHVFALGLMMLILAACQPREIELAFETQEQWAEVLFKGGDGRTEMYKAREPALMIIANPADIAQLENLITSEAQEKLQALDYQTRFAAIVFLGHKQDGGDTITIQRIIQKGKLISIQAVFQGPGPHEGRPLLTASPYHLVQVARPMSSGAAFEFELKINGTVVSTLTRALP